ncbi:hypothetical protein HOK09_02385 [Candidatus Woesearchaeota archaeon]|nr:hypothetical protein [Candidatus Woesearchaeota archaeon]
MTNFYGPIDPMHVPAKLQEVLIPSKKKFESRLDSLEGSIENLGKLLDKIPTSPECEGVFSFEYGSSKEVTNVKANLPRFKDYVESLEFAGAWEGERPSNGEIESMNNFRLLRSLTSSVPSVYDLFHRTEGYKHIQELSHFLRDFIESSPEGNTVPAQRLGFDVVTNNLSYFQRYNAREHKEIIVSMFNDPSELQSRLYGNEETEGVLTLAESYRLLDNVLDLDVLDAIPYSGTGSEHVSEIAPKLKNLKSKSEGHQRVKTLKTFLRLLNSTELDQRADLLDIVNRTLSEQDVDSLSLYGKIQSSGLKPEDYVEFLRSGDQFAWRPDGSDTALANLTSETFEPEDSVTNYLNVVGSKFNILSALNEIASNKQGAPAAKELMLNPSLLFLDNNAVELMTLARDYNQGMLIIERYATVMAEGLHERAEAVLKVGQLRPSRLDLKFIRERMRSLDEQEMGSVIACKTTEELKNLLKSKEKNKSQKPKLTEGVSWFELLIKSMAKRGAKEENIHSVENAHELLSNHEGNPRLLRNMFRTQPRNLGDLCNHVNDHSENETFGIMMQRDSLFQRYKLGLATVEGFYERFSDFVSQEHSNPFNALQSYLPLEEVTPKVETLQEIQSDTTSEVNISDFPGKIFLCGGDFRTKAKDAILKRIPGVIFYGDAKENKRFKINGIREQLNSNDAVFIIKRNISHTGEGQAIKQCEMAGLRPIPCPTRGSASVSDFMESEIGKIMYNLSQEST